MYIEVYIDVVFAVNFILDFIILLLERKISKRNVSLNRVFLGAIVGAVLMCIIIMIPKMNYIVYLAFSYFFSSAIITFVTFRPKKIIELIKLTILLYMIAIFLGGIIFSLYYYFLAGTGIIKGLDLQLLVLLLSIAIIIWIIFINIFFKFTNISKNTYQVRVSYQGKDIIQNGFLDTGNTLYDPISNNPVIVGEIDIFKDFFNEADFLALKKLISNIYDLNYIQDIQEELGINIRWIPFTSLGNENGMLIGIMVEKVIVHIGKEQKENNNVVIALYNNKLSKDNSYTILLHQKLLL